MTAVNIRRQGGAAVMTIPAEVLKALEIEVGARLEIEIIDGAFTVRPREKIVRRRYSLRELLRGATAEAMQELNAETAWAREGDAMGREL